MSRVLLSKDIQQGLCLSAKQRLGCSWFVLSKHLQVSPRALENWYRGINLFPESVFYQLANLTKFSIKDIKTRPDNWGQVKGGEISASLHGGFFGTAEGKKKVVESNRLRSKQFLLPEYSVELAEFIGIMLGDGGIAKDQISVTLGYTTDKEYAPYVISLIHKLFKTQAGIYQSIGHNVIRIRASGVNLVKNLLVLGLVVGNKIEQQFDIPVWIQTKEEYIKACIRGMIDTDGCVHKKVRKERNGVEYRSIGVTFCSYSSPLRISFTRLFQALGFKVAISGNTIYLCGKEQVLRYIDEIGFSNPKHLNRYKNFLVEYGWRKVIP